MFSLFSRNKPSLRVVNSEIGRDVHLTSSGTWFTGRSGPKDPLSIVDLGTGRVLRVLEWSSLRGLMKYVSISPDEKWVVATFIDPNQVVLWDASTGQIQKVLDSWADAAQVSHDGKILALGGHTGSVNLYPFPECEGQRATSLGAHTEGYARQVESLAFVPNTPLLISASANETVRIWDVSSRSELRNLPSKGRPWGLSVHPNGKSFAVACGVRNGSGEILTFALPDGAVMGSIATPKGHPLRLTHSIDGTKIAAEIVDKNYDHSLAILDLQSGSPVFESEEDTGDLAFHPRDANVLLSTYSKGENQCVRLWTFR